MSTTAQLFAFIVSAVCLLFILALVRRDQLRIKYVLLWLPVGFAMILLSAVPATLDATASLLGISYPPALIFLLAISFLVLVCVHLSWEMSRLDERVRSLAEYIAVTQAEGNPAACCGPVPERQRDAQA